MRNHLANKLVFVSVLLLTSLSNAHATSGSWTGNGGSAAWATGNNWNSLASPGTGDTATFNSAGNGFTNIDLGTGITIGNVIFDTSSAAAYTIGLSGSQVLTVNDFGSITLTATVASSQAIASEILLGTATGATYAFTNLSGSTFTISGPIQGGIGGTGGAKTLVIAGNTLVGGAIANGGASALGLQQANGGTLTLTATNSFSGPITGIAGSLVIGGAGTLAASGTYAGTILNNGSFVYSTSAVQTNSALMSGTGGVIINGPGTLALGTSPNSYSGPTIVNGGILQINSSSAGNGFANNSVLTVNSGGELDLNTSDALGYAVNLPVTNYGIIKKLASQSETMFRPIYLSNGSLVTTLANVEQFESFGGFIRTLPNTTNFVSGPGRFGLRTATCYIFVDTNSILTYSVTIDQNTAGAPLNKNGIGTLVLSGTNTFTGNTVVSNGTLLINGSGSLGSGNYSGVISNYGTIAYSSSLNQALSGQITGTGALIVNGPGAVALSGVNNFTGTTTVNGGRLVEYSTQPDTSPVVVNDAGTLTVVGAPTGSFAPSTLTLGSSAGATLQVALQNTTTAPLAPTNLVLKGANTVYLSGNLAPGSYPVLNYASVSGSGTLNFILPNGVSGNVAFNSGNNTYTLTVSSVTATYWDSAVNGTWDINTTGNWSAPSSGNTYIDGSLVQFDDTHNTGAIFGITNLVTTLVSPSTTIINSTNNYSISNVIIGGSGGLIKNGAGNLTNFGSDIYTGPTVINQGQIIAGAASVGGTPFGVNSTITLANSASAAINLNNFSTVVGSINGGGTSGGNVAFGSGTLTVGGDNTSATYSGVISGSGGLALTAAGSLTLANTNTFTGGLTVGAYNTLTLAGPSGQLGSANGNYAGAITLNGQYLYNTPMTNTNSGAITGTGALTVNGPGSLVLANSGDTYTGQTTVNGGILVLQATTGSSGNIRGSTIVINPGGEMDININDGTGYAITLPITNYGIIKKTYTTSQSETMFRPLYMGGGSLVTTLGFEQFHQFGNFVQTLPGTSNSVTGPGAFGLRTASVYFGMAANSTMTWFCTLQNYNASATPIPFNVHGPGTAIIAVPSTFTGGINNTGTVLITNTGNLGGGTSAMNITNTGTFAYGGTTPQTLSGVISGPAGILDVTGPGGLTLSGVNTYGGPTIVAGGPLFLSGSGSIASSSPITVSNGATFDVSGLSSTFTLGGAQVMMVNGGINGSIQTTAGSKIYPGTDGGFGAIVFSNNVTLAANSTFNMDLGPTYNGANDSIVINGSLTVNGNSIHLKAPSSSSPLDLTNYFLISAPAGISGSFNTAPTWDVPPSNVAHYTVLTTTTNVILQYSAIAAPFVSGSTTPSTVVRNQSALISATVIQGNGTVTNVTADLAAFGGPANIPLTLSGTPNVYTNTVVIPPGTPVGAQTIAVTANDTTPLTGSGNIPLTVVSSTEIWDGLGAAENFDTNANWLSGFAPGYAGDSLIFAGTTGLGPVVDNNYIVGGIGFSNNAGAFTIAQTGNSAVTLNNGGGITNSSAVAQTLQTPVVLGGLATLNAAAGNIVLGQPVSEAVAGAGVLTAAGTSTNILDGVNTYTGTTIVNSNSTLVIGGAGQLNNGNYGTAMTVNGLFNYNSSAIQTNGGLISGNGGLTVSGPGTLALGTSPSSYAGPTLVNGGILQINSANGGNGFASNSSYMTIGPSGELDLNASDALGYSLTNVITNYGIIKKLTSQSETLFRPIYMAGGSLVTTLAVEQFESFGNFIQCLPNTTNYISGPGLFGLRTATCYIGVASNSVFNISVPVEQNVNATGTPLNFGGPGTLVMSGASTLTGNIVISNNGTFVLSGGGQLANGPYTGTIADGGAFIDTSSAGQNLNGVISGNGSLQVNGGYLILGAAETYTGPTTVVSNGTLTLALGASINSTASIYVGTGSLLDGSAATGFSMTGNQTLSGYGTINGSIGTTPDTIIFPGTDGTYGTLTFNNNLTNAIGASMNYDLGTLTTGDGGQNDFISVGGTLVLSGNNAIHIKAPSTSVSLDTKDYVLITANNGFQGSFLSQPVWTIRPANANNYSVLTGPSSNPNAVVLHYSPATPPGGIGTATPSLGVLRNEAVLLTVTVTSNSSTIVSVTADASPVGGSVIGLNQQSANVYTNTVIIPAGTGPGPETLTATITDANGLIATPSINFNVVTSTEKWNGAGPDANWDDNTNWLSGAAPGYVGDSLVFAGTAQLSPLMDQTYSVGGLGFDNTAGAFTIGTASSSLTVSVGITNNSSHVQTINTPLSLSAAPTLAAVTSDLVIAGPLTLTGTLDKEGPRTVFLKNINTYNGPTTLGQGTLDFDLANDIVIPGLISGGGSLVMDGSADVTLTNNDTFSGGTTVNNGTLTLSVGGATGTIGGVLTINSNGTVNLTVRDAIGYTAGVCVSNLIINGGDFNMAQDNAGFATVVNMTGGTISDNGAPLHALFNFSSGFNLNTYASSNSAVISAGIDIRGANLVITTALGTVSNGPDLLVSGIINNSNNATGGGLTKTGPGSAIFAGQNTYNGVTVFAGGTLQAGVAENSGVNGPFGANNASGAISFAGGSLQYSPLNQFDYSSRFSTAGGQPISIDTSNQAVTFATALTSSAGSLTKVGLGTLTLAAANTYSGPTTISGGTLAIGNGGSLAASSSVIIGAGGLLDVTGLASYTLGASASLNASGTIASPAAITGTAAEPISLGSSPITLNYDSAGPALTISNGTLSLNGNAFTVNTSSPLAPGSYVVATQLNGTISSAGSYTVTGTAIGNGSQGSISVSGQRVVLTINAGNFTPTNLIYSVSGTTLNLAWPSSYLGWFLQSNSISLGITNDWFTVSGSQSSTNAAITINKAGPAVFYRLQAP
jgi:autotransporter-associated beta strand protein